MNRWKMTGYVCIYAWFLCATMSACSGTDHAQTFSFREEEETWQQTEADVEEEKEAFVWVHVCGSVQKEGVYRLAEGSRAVDAVLAAGGFTEEAKQDSLNLAALLTDGQKLYVLSLEEALQQEEKAESGAGNGLVNINTASEEELCTLTGIGHGRAMDIITYREKNGPFKQPEDLMKVSGIKDSVYSKISDKIAVNE